MAYARQRLSVLATLLAAAAVHAQTAGSPTCPSGWQLYDDDVNGGSQGQSSCLFALTSAGVASLSVDVRDACAQVLAQPAHLLTLAPASLTEGATAGSILDTAFAQAAPGTQHARL
jgi:hypothetical protein